VWLRDHTTKVPKGRRAESARLGSGGDRRSNPATRVRRQVARSEVRAAAFKLLNSPSRIALTQEFRALNTLRTAGCHAEDMPDADAA